MAHLTFARGDQVVAIDASERGIPITEGHIYTVKRMLTSRQIEDITNEAIIASRAAIPGVELEEVPGYFMVTRFAPLSA